MNLRKLMGTKHTQQLAVVLHLYHFSTSVLHIKAPYTYLPTSVPFPQKACSLFQYFIFTNNIQKFGNVLHIHKSSKPMYKAPSNFALITSFTQTPGGALSPLSHTLQLKLSLPTHRHRPHAHPPLCLGLLELFRHVQPTVIHH